MSIRYIWKECPKWDIFNEFLRRSAEKRNISFELLLSNDERSMDENDWGRMEITPIEGATIFEISIKKDSKEIMYPRKVKFLIRTKINKHFKPSEMMTLIDECRIFFSKKKYIEFLDNI